MKKYRLTISEPWDFDSQRGDNEIHGIVVRQVDSENLLFVADEQVTFKGTTSPYWILSTRYENQHFGEQPYRGTVNGGLISNFPSETEDALQLKGKAVFAIIGSIEPI